MLGANGPLHADTMFANLSVQNAEGVDELGGGTLHFFYNANAGVSHIGLAMVHSHHLHITDESRDGNLSPETVISRGTTGLRHAGHAN